MIEINLLPWREQVRTEQQRVLKKIIIATVLIAVTVVISLHLILLQQTNVFTQRVQMLRHQINKLTLAVPKNPEDKFISPFLIDRMNTYQAATRKLFSELFQQENNQVCFVNIFRKKNTITFLGYAHTLLELNQFINDWAVGQLYANVLLEKVVQRNKQLVFFRLKIPTTELDLNAI